jgi:hypothetical protein
MDEASKHSWLASLARQIEQKQVARAELVHQLAHLDTSLSAIQSKYNGIKNETAPISMLPNELLATIIEIGCRLAETKSHSCPFEVVVSHVTRHWRTIALGTPRIWAKIRRYSSQKSLDSIAAYLQRSKAVPLDLSVDMGEGTDHQDHFTPFCQLINPHVNRWRRLRVTYASWEDHRKWLQGMPLACPRILQSIDIFLEKMGDGIIRTPHTIFPNGAPRLTSVRVKGVGWFCWMPPLRAVTTLCLDNDGVDHTLWTSFHELQVMFRHMSCLTHLIVSGDIAESWPPGVTIELVTLKSLDIRADPAEDDAGQISGLLLAISAPSLESLALRVVEENDFRRYIQSTISDPPKFQALRSLVLDLLTAMEAPCLEGLCRSFPTVTQFTYVGDTHRFLPVLQNIVGAPVSPSTVIWPDLHTIAFRPTLSKITSIHDIVAGRIRMGHPIRRLCVPKKLLLDVLKADEWQWLRDHVHMDEFKDDKEKRLLADWSDD